MARCAACGAAGLRPHLRVAGGGGPLIPTTDRFGSALGDFARCGACGHLQLDPMPSPADLAGAYAEAASDDYVEEEAGQRETARRVLERIERFVAPGALADLGPWVGFLMAEAVTRGWRPVGVEPSAWAAAYARDRLGLDVRTGALLTEPLPAAAFDAVTLGDVIEHLPDPGAGLRRVREILRPDGVVWLATPDAGSRLARLLGPRWWSVIPTHVHLFTRPSLSALLRRHDFEVLDVATAPKAFSTAYYLGRVGGYSRRAGDGLVRAAARARVAERMVAPDLRDRVQVVARMR